MYKKDLAQHLEDIVDEVASISKKDKDALLDVLTDFLVHELGVEVDEDEEDEEDV